MIRGLAIETSGRAGSVALAEEGVVVEEEHFPQGLKHAAELVPVIDRLCRNRAWAPRDISEIYISVGPGSFTGLRVGVAAAKTLAFATGAWLVAVPTLEVLARNAPPEAVNVLIVLDAKREQIFTSRLRRDSGGVWATKEPAHLDTLAAMLARSPRPVFLTGEGIPYHQKSIPPDDPDIIVTDPSLWRARAAEVVAVGYRLARQGRFTEPDRLTPAYIRKPEAEEKLQAVQQHGPAAGDPV